MYELCQAGVFLAERKNSTFEQVVASDPQLGFGRIYGQYYGPGGGNGEGLGDTTTKLGVMLSADGKTLYGLAEHRNYPWNTRFTKCIYFILQHSVRNYEDGLASFEKSKHCQDGLKNALVVDYSN